MDAAEWEGQTFPLGFSSESGSCAFEHQSLYYVIPLIKGGYKCKLL